jgi:uracil-DNA glycosylase family protein
VNDFSATAHAIARARDEAAGCRRCPLYQLGTQTVFGEGLTTAPAMLVGKQPGDQEDLQGRPFVGPAGRILNNALEAAKIDRSKLYVTNAVKHFKNERRGKRRLHKKPNASEIDRCKWWLDIELEIVKPKVGIALGATAARSLMGQPMKIEASRGRRFPFGADQSLVVTIHPSFLLRLPDPTTAAAELRRFVADLCLVADLIPAIRHAT